MKLLWLSMALALASCGGGMPVYAHDHWINHGKYKDKHGVHCCDERDIERLDPSRVTITRDGFLIDGKVFFPKEEAKPSEDGFFWVAWKVWGREARCFFPPIGGV